MDNSQTAHPSLQSTLSELAIITASLSRIQVHAQSSHREILTLQGRVNDLQRRTTTRELEREKYAEEKDAAVTKMSRVKSVLQDLLDEITSDDSPGDANLGLSRGGRQAPEDASDDAESDGTVHQSSRQAMQARVPTISQVVGPSRSEVTGPQPKGMHPNPRQGVSTKPEPGVGSVQGVSKTTSPRGTAESSSSSFHINAPQRPVPTETDLDVWKLHYNKPPVTSSKPLVGALSWRDLQHRLKLNEETMSSLESLGLMPDHGLRVHIYNDLAFVYDPISLEAPTASFLIDWGRKRVNKRIGKLITHGRPANPVFHTFLYPVTKDSWYYVGAHTWIVANLSDVWPTLGDNSKRTLIAKLHGRCGGAQDDIEEMLNEGELQQFCVEVVHGSHGHEAISREFVVAQMGYGAEGTR